MCGLPKNIENIQSETIISVVEAKYKDKYLGQILSQFWSATNLTISSLKIIKTELSSLLSKESNAPSKEEFKYAPSKVMEEELKSDDNLDIDIDYESLKESKLIETAVHDKLFGMYVHNNDEKSCVILIWEDNVEVWDVENEIKVNSFPLEPIVNFVHFGQPLAIKQLTNGLFFVLRVMVIELWDFYHGTKVKSFRYPGKPFERLLHCQLFYEISNGLLLTRLNNGEMAVINYESLNKLDVTPCMISKDVDIGTITNVTSRNEIIAYNEKNILIFDIIGQYSLFLTKTVKISDSPYFFTHMNVKSLLLNDKVTLAIFSKTFVLFIDTERSQVIHRIVSASAADLIVEYVAEVIPGVVAISKSKKEETAKYQRQIIFWSVTKNQEVHVSKSASSGKMITLRSIKGNLIALIAQGTGVSYDQHTPFFTNLTRLTLQLWYCPKKMVSVLSTKNIATKKAKKNDCVCIIA